MSDETKKRPGQKKPYQTIKTMHKDTGDQIAKIAEIVDDKAEYVTHAAVKVFDSLPIREKVAAIQSARVELAESNAKRAETAQAVAEASAEPVAA